MVQQASEPGRNEESLSRTLEVEALLDTGANRHNFISESLARDLAAHGVQYEPCHVTLHFAQRGTSTIVNKKMSFETFLFNQVTQLKEPLVLRDAMVVPVLRYDIIVGLPTIKSEDLIPKLTNWCVSAQCVSDDCGLRPGKGGIPATQARTVGHSQRCGSSQVAQKFPSGYGCSHGIANAQVAHKSPSEYSCSQSAGGAAVKAANRSSGGAKGSFKAEVEGTASSKANLRVAGEAMCACELCSLPVGSGEFFGPEDEDDESVQLEAAPNIADLLPDQSNSSAGGPVSTTHAVDTSQIFFQQGRTDVTPDFVSEMRGACEDFKAIFADTVRAEPAKIPPFELEVDSAVLKWGRLSARARPQSSVKIVKLREMLNQLLRLGIIRASKQPVGSHTLLVVKKGSDKLRLCIDFRAINDATKSAEGWPIPHIDELLREIGASRPKFFGTMDMTQSYFQAPIRESDKKWTAFVTPGGGIYEWNRLPMGLKGAGSYLQRNMAAVIFADILHKLVKIYLDDLIVYAETQAEFIHAMREVFAHCRKFNITLNPAKCRFGMAEVEYVGHKIDGEGLSFTKDRTDGIAAMPEPQTAGDMKMFLGMVNYFHQHIRNLSTMTEPLNEMLGKYEKKSAQRRLEWTPARRHAFQQVKEAVGNCPTLFFADHTSPIFLQTDASEFGIGAYLFQVVDGVERPVAFLSKSLNRVQRKWAIPDKEAYAIFYSLKKWDHLLRDVKFTLQTDHENLTYINFEGTPKVRRWKLLIQEYDFILDFIKGEKNIIADAGSRLCENIDFAKSDGPEAEGAAAGGGARAAQVSTESEADELMEIFLSDLDPDELISMYTEIESPDELFAFLDDEVAIPQSIYDELEAAHNSVVGHSGVKRTILKLRRKGVKMKYMRDYVDKFIKQCPLCQKLDERRLPVHVKPLTMATYRAMQRINIDAIGPLPETEDGYKFILVVIDTFSRWVMLYPTKSTGGEECAKALIQHFGLFGVASEVLSDKANQQGETTEVLSDGGSQLDNATVRQALELIGARHNISIAHSSEENAIVERANKEVVKYVRGFVYDSKAPKEWEDFLPFIQRTMNAEVVSALGFSPADIVFGKAINLDRSVLVPNKVIACEARPDLAEYVRKLIEVQKHITEVAARSQRDIDAANIVKRGGEHITEFPVHSYVTVEYPESVSGRRAAPSKVMTPRRGPFLVLSHKDHEYTLEDIVNHKTLSRVHVTRLRKFVFDTTRKTAEEIAAHDNMEFYVESVLDHEPKVRPDRHRSDLMFKIHWLGYNESYDSWEPWSELRANSIVHAYMRQHNMSRIISPLYSGGGGGGGGGGL